MDHNSGETLLFKEALHAYQPPLHATQIISQSFLVQAAVDAKGGHDRGLKAESEFAAMVS